MTAFDAHDRALAEQLFADLQAASVDTVGITRESYGPGETAAARIIADCARRHGLEVSYDAAANLTVTLPGRDAGLPFLACGSHLDSVPQGGNYDGAAGIIAGLMALIRFRRDGLTPARPVKLLALRGEESAWFGKAYTGSRALFGRLLPADLQAQNAFSGRTLGEAMAACGADIEQLAAGEPVVTANQMSGWLELHIEQGPILVAEELPVAIVTGIRGNIRHRNIACIGEAGHSGAVPRNLRHDALFATAELITRMDACWKEMLDRGEDLVLTAGVIGTLPEEHAISRIPGQVGFSFEARSQHQATLQRVHDRLQEECKAIAAQRGVRFEFDALLKSSPAELSRDWVDSLERIAADMKIPARTMASGAGHDAAVFANMGVPSAMIFVRNQNGSHNPHEAMDMEDFFAGASLLHAALAQAAQ
ncbi:allantoate amidohydrolase [Ferrovibrio sp.]|uniref:allantoate amidohydrolase n=1 Tax=Ferrovibrio sp. TaxID=1917215 RepID=UPI000CC68EA7|nr:allantoate amidohydrolase [Ferrovibrio sp.]PJI43499.1 MAG: Zn-dependent hydrolase [Ferrovibrio sp.]